HNTKVVQSGCGAQAARSEPLDEGQALAEELFSCGEIALQRGDDAQVVERPILPYPTEVELALQLQGTHPGASGADGVPSPQRDATLVDQGVHHAWGFRGEAL